MRRALTWLLVLGWAGLIFFLSAQPAYAFPQLLWSEVLSVVIHLALYAVLMRLLLRALGGGSAPTASRMLWLAFGLVALYAASDEFHQSFVPGRVATAFDWLTDLTGAALAWWGQRRRAGR